jgi:hypothetical protein
MPQQHGPQPKAQFILKAGLYNRLTGDRCWLRLWRQKEWKYEIRLTSLLDVKVLAAYPDERRAREAYYFELQELQRSGWTSAVDPEGRVYH